MTTNAEEEWQTSLQKKTISWCMVPISKAPPLLNTSTGMSGWLPPTYRGCLTQTEAQESQRQSQWVAGAATPVGREATVSRVDCFSCRTKTGKKSKTPASFWNGAGCHEGWYVAAYNLRKLQEKFTNKGKLASGRWQGAIHRRVSLSLSAQGIKRYQNKSGGMELKNGLGRWAEFITKPCKLSRFSPVP